MLCVLCTKIKALEKRIIAVSDTFIDAMTVGRSHHNALNVHLFLVETVTTRLRLKN